MKSLPARALRVCVFPLQPARTNDAGLASPGPTLLADPIDTPDGSPEPDVI